MSDKYVRSGIRVDTASLIQIGTQVARLPLDFKVGARSILAGAHRSRFRGRGMDFAESREYQPGDDVRHIDWRVTARTNTVHTKLFVEERERPVFLLMDFSESMFFGTRSCFKSVTAARAGAYLAWSAIAGGDRLGGFVAGGEREITLKPGSGRRAVLKLLRSIADATANFNQQSGVEPGKLLGIALKHCSAVIHPGSLVFVLSDFYGLNQQHQKYLSLLQRHNDVVCIEVLDQLEALPPSPGKYLVSDGNNILKLDTSNRSGRKRYQQVFNSRQNNTRNLLEGLAIPLVSLVGGTDIIGKLLQTFGRGKKRAAA